MHLLAFRSVSGTLERSEDPRSNRCAPRSFITRACQGFLQKVRASLAELPLSALSTRSLACFCLFFSFLVQRINRSGTLSKRVLFSKRFSIHRRRRSFITRAFEGFLRMCAQARHCFECRAGPSERPQSALLRHSLILSPRTGSAGPSNETEIVLQS